LGETSGASFFFLSNFERLRIPKMKCTHGALYPKSCIDLCKASLAHPS
jgi:hypothetical protein